MKQDIQKASLLAALADFRRDLVDMNLREEDRRNLMDKFKDAYNRSLDPDLAMDAIYNDLMRATRNAKAGKSIFKGFWSQMLGNSEERNMRQLIDNSYKQGQTEDQILEALTNRAMSQVSRPLTVWERDILRMLTVDEKVRMRDAGVIKNLLAKFIKKH